MNIQMITNSQLSTTESKNKKENKLRQTTRTGRESQKWRSLGGLLAGREKGENEGKVQGLRSINC